MIYVFSVLLPVFFGGVPFAKRIHRLVPQPLRPKGEPKEPAAGSELALSWLPCFRPEGRALGLMLGLKDSRKKKKKNGPPPPFFLSLASCCWFYPGLRRSVLLGCHGAPFECRTPCRGSGLSGSRRSSQGTSPSKPEKGEIAKKRTPQGSAPNDLSQEGGTSQTKIHRRVEHQSSRIAETIHKAWPGLEGSHSLPLRGSKFLRRMAFAGLVS